MLNLKMWIAVALLELTWTAWSAPANATSFCHYFNVCFYTLKKTQALSLNFKERQTESPSDIDLWAISRGPGHGEYLVTSGTWHSQNEVRVWCAPWMERGREEIPWSRQSQSVFRGWQQANSEQWQCLVSPQSSGAVSWGSEGPVWRWIRDREEREERGQTTE